MENRKSLRMSSFFIAALLISLALTSAGCCGNRWMLYFDKPISGAVVDADNGEPIQDAVIVAQWQLQNIIYQGFGGYAKIIVETSDNEGKFKIPFWVSYKPWKFYASVMEYEPTIIVYKPGYKLYRSTEYNRKGDPTWPVKPTMTEEEKKKIVGQLYFDVRQYSVNPVRLKRVFADKEIWDQFGEFESKTDLSLEYYSVRQIKAVLDALSTGSVQLSDENAESKRKIQKDVNNYKKNWLRGAQ
jgi:hypothetical protein